MTESGNGKASIRLDKLAITISPPPHNDIKAQLNKWKRRFSKLKSLFMLYPEIAYNAKNNTIRLHFHGWMEGLDIVTFQKDIEYLKGFCFVDVKKISSFTGWLKYCKKELKKTKISLGLKKNANIMLTNNNCKEESESRDILEYFINKTDDKICE